MSPRITLATARRVAAQLRRDHRTLALILVVPPALLTLLRYVLDQPPGAFQRVGAPLIGLFPLVIMFLIASIAMLRERTSGTLERLMSMPLGKLDLLAGYGLAFGLLAALQGTITALVGFWLLDIETAGPAWAVVAAGKFPDASWQLVRHLTTKEAFATQLQLWMMPARKSLDTDAFWATNRNLPLETRVAFQQAAKTGRATPRVAKFRKVGQAINASVGKFMRDEASVASTTQEAARELDRLLAEGGADPIK